MVMNLAQYGYRSPAIEQETRPSQAFSQPRENTRFNADDRFSNIQGLDGFSSLARGLQSGFGIRPKENSEESSATSEASAFNATTASSNRGSFGRHDFNAVEYGKAKDAEAVAAGDADEGSFTQDADREKAVDEKKPNMAMGVDLDKLDQLKGYDPQAIALAGRSINNHSVEEMKENFSKTGFLTPEAAEPSRIAEIQAQEHAREFQAAMKTPERQAQNGPEATYKGAVAATDMARVAGGMALTA